MRFFEKGRDSNLFFSQEWVFAVVREFREALNTCSKEFKPFKKKERKKERKKKKKKKKTRRM